MYAILSIHALKNIPNQKSIVYVLSIETMKYGNHDLYSLFIFISRISFLFALCMEAAKLSMCMKIYDNLKSKAKSFFKL